MNSAENPLTASVDRPDYILQEMQKTIFEMEVNNIMSEKNGLNYKTRVLAKVYSTGCRDEASFLRLGLPDFLKMPGLTVADIQEICELQRQVKNHTLFSYLGGGIHEHNGNGGEKDHHME